MSEQLALSPQEAKRLPKPNNMIPVMTHLESDFFRLWCIFLKPFVNLTSREIDVMASFLKHRWELTKAVSDPSIVDTMMSSESMKKKVMEECHITKQHFYVVMSTLKKKGIIEDGIIKKKLIPNLSDDGSGCFQLLILFKEIGKK
jgi:hypothetical protein